MHRFKKNLGFNLGLIVLGAAFLLGLVLAVLAYRGGVESSLKLRGVTVAEVGLLKGHAFAAGEEPVSLNEDNVKAAQADVADLVGHRDKLRSLIAGNPEMAIRGKASANSAELSALLRESVDGWRKLATDQGVKFTPNEPTSFGFHRYIHNQGTSPKRDFQKGDQQRLIAEFLFKELVESRPAPTADYKVPLLLLSLAREPIEVATLIPEGKPGAGTYAIEGTDQARYETEEFAPTRTFRRSTKDKEGRPVPLVDTVSFRLKFISNTVTLRTFVNRLRNSGKPFAITSVEVTPPPAEIIKIFQAPAVAATPVAPGPAFDLSGFGDNGSKPKAATPPKEDRKVVITEHPSEFTVQVDYLVVLEPKPAASEGEPKK